MNINHNYYSYIAIHQSHTKPMFLKNTIAYLYKTCTIQFLVNKNALEATFKPTLAPRSEMQPVSTDEIDQPNN